MTLRATIESDVSNVLLVTDEFAEVVTYYPVNGPQRSVRAIVEEMGATVDQTHGLASVETILVTVSRDRTATNDDGATVGGIDTPQLGDGLKRAGDGPDKLYAWSGDKSDVDDYAWQLTFTRNVIIKHGGSWQPSR